MRRFIQFLVLMFLTSFAYAQPKQVSGTVTDKSNAKPLEGVTVVSKSGTTQTDKTGYFMLDAAAGEIITFSYVGFKSFSYPVTGTETNIAIQMNIDNQNLDDVVVVGYTSERKKDLKGAVAVVKMSDVLKETNANIATSLQGRVAGLDVSTDGAPGSGIKLTLRGIGSFNFNAPPLWVIDGVPTYDFNGLSPNDIESLQVLKDAASAAIYGARGAGGVILITTKKGKSSTARVSVDGYFGTRNIIKNYDMLSAQQYGDMLWKAYKNDGVTPSDPIYGNGATPVIPAYIDAPNNTTPSANTNWQDESFQPATSAAVNFSVSQAAEKSNFYFGVNYNKEEGILTKTFYERVTARINSSFKVGKRITIGENMSIGYLRGNRENEGRVVEGAFLQHPLVPLKDNLGNWGGPFASLGDYRNPVGDLNRFEDNITKGWRTFGNAFVNIEIIKGLTYRASFGADVVNSRLKFFEDRYVMGRFSSDVNKLTESNTQSVNLTATHTLNYALKKGNHDINLLAGYEWINNKFETFSATANNFFLESDDYVYLSTGTPLTSSGTGSEYGLTGMFGKINYSYNDRFLFSASIRRDGSSRFGPENRYGVFPAVSGAWRIAGEEFFRGSKASNTISDLKLRASWGQNGNDAIRNYNYATFFGPSIDYANYDIFSTNRIGNWNNATGFIVSSIGNPNTKWEAVSQTNIGLDIGFLNNRLYVTADYYIKESQDLLYQVVLPSVVGEGVRPFINVGDIRNSGIELTVSYKNNTAPNKLNWGLDFNLASNHNEVQSIGLDGNDIQYPGQHILKKGLSIAEFFGYQADGIFKSQAEVDAHPAQDGKGIGRLRFRDVNGDNKIDADDRTTLGSPLAKLIMGLNANLSYKGFDATLFFDSKIGNKIWDQSKWNLQFMGYTSNKSTDILNAWSPENPNATIPALSNNNANFDKQNSSYYISDGSYVRLKSLVIGYTLPKKTIAKAGLSNLRFYAQAQNIFSITGYKGLDFDLLNADLASLGVYNLNHYPHTKGWTFGMNIGF